ncbi:MAG TPA: LysM peptidoglycan-binding domain-containing protein, partial [Anaerolineales bacterium]|nr:LysM peptidoglycan-binding domain-containing protein [Anaerolineales bacterium]
LLRRGAQFVHGLRSEIGDDAFFTFLQDYYRNGAYRTVNAADFFNALRRHTDSNLDGLLTEYFIGQTMPTPAPTLTPIPTNTPEGPPPPTPTVHVVQPGESLTLIAQKYGLTVDAIVQANQLKNPDAIYAGQKLVIPAP